MKTRGGIIMGLIRVFIGTQPILIVDDEYYEIDIYNKNVALQKNRGLYKGLFDVGK